MKTSILILSLLFVSFAAFADDITTKAESGSGGTSGGGNNKLSAIAQIPNSISIEGGYKYPKSMEDMYIGERGLFGWDTYAYELFMKMSFDKKAFLTGVNEVGPRGTKYRFWGVYDKMSKELPLTSKTSYGLESKWGNIPLSSVALIADDWWFMDNVKPAEPYSAKIHYNGKPITLKQLYKKLEQIADTASKEVDFKDFDSMKPLLIIQKFFRELHYGSRDPLIDFQTGVYCQVKSDHDQFMEIGMSAIDANGGCNAEKYAELLANLKSWTLGSKWFFYQLERKAKIKLSDEIVSAIRSFRTDLHQTIADSVTPFCEDPKNYENGQSQLDLVLKD